MEKTICLSVAGVDNLGLSGIYNDLKTFHSLNCYGVGVITAITSQTNQKVQSIFAVPKKHIEEQFITILETFSVNATKIGMVYSRSTIQFLKQNLKYLNSIVLDPVIQSSSGNFLIQKNAIMDLLELFPKVHLVTPNIPELFFILKQKKIKETYETKELEDKCIEFYKIYKTPILLKGGHNLYKNFSIDIFYDGIKITHFKNKVLIKKNIRGTGCTLSSAIACFLAKKKNLFESIQLGEKYLQNKIQKSEELDSKTNILWH